MTTIAIAVRRYKNDAQNVHANQAIQIIAHCLLIPKLARTAQWFEWQPTQCVAVHPLHPPPEIILSAPSEPRLMVITGMKMRCVLTDWQMGQSAA